MNTRQRTETKAKSNKEKALDVFMARKAEIDAMLVRLTALSADHFDTSPEEINWGHVGNLGRYASLLKQITDMAFNEGEHAEWGNPLPYRPAPPRWPGLGLVGRPRWPSTHPGARR